ncbi:MAG TPA: SRPBCC domain-containing protein [Stellaceae bacterium]|nr:SRPBCC domain-containing protein [Stellaceae bacterium]
MRASAGAEAATIGIELQRRFRASPERIFRAWTEPAALRDWWCPPGWIAAEIAVDLRVGGAYCIAMRRIGDSAPVSVRGQFLEVRPPDRLVYTWRWEGAFAQVPETLVTLELRGSGDNTLLTIRHENFADAGILQQHRSGWIAACNRLDRVVSVPAALHDRLATH